MQNRYDFGPNPVILGQGPAATVYKVADTQLKRFVALKVFTREDALDDSELASVARVAGISAPNVVGITDHGRIRAPGTEQPLPFIAMEYSEGRTLAGDALARVSWADVAPKDARAWCADAMEVIRQCFLGLQQLHHAQIKHLGVKPSNILITRDSVGRASAAKILDAGLLRVAEQRARALYRAPEQFAGEEVTFAADVFSMGVVAYELLTRRHPFAGASGRIEGEVLARNIATVVPANISELNRYVPDAIALVIHKTLAKEPADRPSSEEVVRMMDSASLYSKQWLAVSGEVDKARALYERGDLENASSILVALEKKGWAFPQIVELRARINGELTLRTSVLERQAEDIAAAEEAINSGHRRQAWWRIELLRARQECDPYRQSTHGAELERLQNELHNAHENETKWLARVSELLNSGRFEEAASKCGQIGKSVRPTKAVLARELECRAFRYRPVISRTLLALDADTQEERTNYASAAMNEIHATPNALAECFQLLEARSGLIDELRFELATHHDAGDIIAELDVMETLLTISPDQKLAEQQKALEAIVQRQLTEQRLAIWLETIQRVVAVGDWTRARALIGSAAAEFQDNPKLAELHRQRTPEHAPVEAKPQAPAVAASVAQASEPKPQHASAAPEPAAQPVAAATNQPKPAARPARPQSQPRKSHPRPRTLIGIGVGSIVLMLLASVGIPAGKVNVTFDNVPPGATLMVDGMLVDSGTAVLAPGTHRWALTGPGYETASSEFEVGRKPTRVAVKRHAASAAQPVAAQPVEVAPPPVFGSVLVVTPGQDDVAVIVDKKTVGHTLNGEFVIDSLEPGAHTIAVKAEGRFCLDDPGSRSLTVEGDAQRTDTFALKPWPRLVVNSDAPGATFTVNGSDSDSHRVGQEVPLEPGKHRYTVRAATHNDSTAEVLLKCAENRTVAVSLRPVVVATEPPRETPAASKSTDAGWKANCFKPEIGWQKATRDCFYDDGDALRRYRFEVRKAKKGGVGPVGGSGVYGPWLIGTEESFIEAKVEDGEFRWRAAGRGDWHHEKVQLPKDASSLFVRVTTNSEGATLDIGADAAMIGAQRVRVQARGGFGVKKDAQIRDFKRS